MSVALAPHHLRRDETRAATLTVRSRRIHCSTSWISVPAGDCQVLECTLGCVPGKHDAALRGRADMMHQAECGVAARVSTISHLRVPSVSLHQKSLAQSCHLRKDRNRFWSAYQKVHEKKCGLPCATLGPQREVMTPVQRYGVLLITARVYSRWK
jgi:hypothetical protein